MGLGNKSRQGNLLGERPDDGDDVRLPLGAAVDRDLEWRTRYVTANQQNGVACEYVPMHVFAQSHLLFAFQCPAFVSCAELRHSTCSIVKHVLAIVTSRAVGGDDQLSSEVFVSSND